MTFNVPCQKPWSLLLQMLSTISQISSHVKFTSQIDCIWCSVWKIMEVMKPRRLKLRAMIENTNTFFATMIVCKPKDILGIIRLKAQHFYQHVMNIIKWGCVCNDISGGGDLRIWKWELLDHYLSLLQSLKNTRCKMDQLRITKCEN